jgi:hypothetical protein
MEELRYANVLNVFRKSEDGRLTGRAKRRWKGTG